MRAYRFQVDESIFEFVFLLDAQRWTGKHGMSRGIGGAYLKLLKAVDPRWQWWSPRPLPVWEVQVYGLRHRFNQYMNAEHLAALMHSHHKFIKNVEPWWCLYCHPERGGTVMDLGAVPVYDEEAGDE
jgi:hypothetical protein